MEKVFLVPQKTYDPEGVRAAAIEIITGSGIDPRGRTVFIKPNFVYPSHTPETVAVVTQPPFVRGVVKAFRDLGAREVLVGEDSVLGPSRAAFYAMGVYPYIRGIATPVYFDEQRHVRVKVPGALVQDSFIIPAVWPEADLFVSLPKIKVNHFARATLSVKNHMGFQRQFERCRNHSDGTLQEKIADLYRVRPPDLVIADTIVAGEGQGPMQARPVELGVIAGGANGPAVDAVCCRLMGIDPRGIEHLRYLEEAGVGPLGENDIEVQGGRIEDFAREFECPSTDLVGVNENLRVILGEEKCCFNGCRGMIRTAVGPWLDRKEVPLRELTVIAGKGISGLPGDLDRRRTLVVGDCAEEHRDRGHYLPGCSPHPMDTSFAFLKFLGYLPIQMRTEDLAKGYVAGYGWKAARFFTGSRSSVERGE